MAKLKRQQRRNGHSSGGPQSLLLGQKWKRTKRKWGNLCFCQCCFCFCGRQVSIGKSSEQLLLLFIVNFNNSNNKASRNVLPRCSPSVLTYICGWKRSRKYVTDCSPPNRLTIHLVACTRNAKNAVARSHTSGSSSLIRRRGFNAENVRRGTSLSPTAKIAIERVNASCFRPLRPYRFVMRKK